METRTYKVYKFKELTEDQQQKVIGRYYDINVDHEWWDYLYDDAKNIGIKIDGFDLGGRQSIEGDLIDSVADCIKKIKDQHGKTCETYKTALRYEKEAKRLFKLQDWTDEEYTAQENLNHEFKTDILEDYFQLLRKEYEYLTSEEAITETLEINEYDFTEDGKID